MIIIEPFGGLANRLRVITSAMQFGDETDQDIKLIWLANEDLGCEFSDLFEPIERVEAINKLSKYKHVKASIQAYHTKRFLAHAINKVLGVDYCIKEKDFKRYIKSKKIDLSSIVSKYDNTYFQTCQKLNFKENLKYFDELKPVFEIQNTIDRVTSKFDEKTVGLHIRRTDNTRAIKFSPTSLFIDRIEKELTKDIDSNFFLATDDLDTEERLRKKFGSKINSYEKVISRNTKKGIFDALIDLYCLSNTRYIYGSYWSSFSYIASRIGKIDIIQLKQ